MKFVLKNVGVIKQAEFSLGELTIICGSNNTGKTYATYTLYGFLFYWHNFSIEVDKKCIQHLLNDGTAEIDIQEYVDAAQSILDNWCKFYSKQLPVVFAANEKYFSEASFSIILDKDDIKPMREFHRNIVTSKSSIFRISKDAGSSVVTISLLIETDKFKILAEAVKDAIGYALKEIIFDGLFPNPFISSAERTGAAIFRKELNFARNRILEEISSREKNVDPLMLLKKAYSDYALPVKSNVEFTRQLEEHAKKESFIAKDYPKILNAFADIIGGSYTVTRNDELYYTPNGGKRVKLTMDESSSSVRSLLDVGFYLRHTARRGDLFMVDEPEMNLHPENQRRMVRLLAKLVNIGINVFITTHSDYIIKELNTLIMLHQGGERLDKLAKREHYDDLEKMDPRKLKVYIAEDFHVLCDGNTRKRKCPTLVEAKIDESYGIEARSFDKTIEDMNRIQDEIIWGE